MKVQFSNRIWLLIFLMLSSVLLQSCISHYFVDADTRIQVENNSDQVISQVAILADLDRENIVLFSGEVQPFSKSRVSEISYTGTFRFGAMVRDSLCEADTCWQSNELGNHRLSGGSVILQFNGVGDELGFQILKR